MWSRGYFDYRGVGDDEVRVCWRNSKTVSLLCRNCFDTREKVVLFCDEGVVRSSSKNVTLVTLICGRAQLEIVASLTFVVVNAWSRRWREFL